MLTYTELLYAMVYFNFTHIFCFMPNVLSEFYITEQSVHSEQLSAKSSLIPWLLFLTYLTYVLYS